ncbi:MAG TPA: alpha/beta fold hydrolase [Pseudonocardiaceae bacterium]|nr:alpha/beta fold hydrolase [Pseudonocardiaceae bacterium]
MNNTTTDWIRRFHPAPDAPAQLVCLPHAGGSASFFYGVAEQLAPQLDVLAVQYPGRQDRRNDPMVDDIDELADRITDELVPTMDRPTALFGHSMGATLAFEVAKRLVRRGVPPLCLFVSGRRAPSRHRPETRHLLPANELVDEIKAVGGTDARLLDDDELMDVVLPVLRNDYRAIETNEYVPSAKLPCPVFAMIGDDDPMADDEDTAAWGEHTTGLFEMRTFPGGHFYLTAHATTVTALMLERITAMVTGRPIRTH